ncbi:MAG: hypothetical protein R3253_16605 [Longimicrobiales bacterium]|nr:hypothetical protein [Longimicrobiales bacterium]
MTRFQRWFLYLSTAAATVSGVGYVYMKRFMTPTDPWAVINHPLEPWFLKAHILTAPLMLFAVGLITTQHIWRSLKSSLPTGRKTGVAAAATFGPLVLTGYLIQAVASPLALDVLGWIHLGLGLVCAVAIFEHRRLVRGRKRKKSRGDLPILTIPATPPEVRPAAASEDATPSASGRRGRRSGSYRPRTDRQEESSSAASP